ncbi:MAG: NAD-dependent protein deacylase [Clostridia bacterium]|nr:NAD-dependent protein deacylase [Clostridia bacterium]
MKDKLERLKALVKQKKRIVFFGGAGVSTESGIPDFRSKDGLYNQEYDYAYSPEELLSRTIFDYDKEEFFRFYRERILVKGVEPSRAHIALAELEEKGKLTAVITQNIDGLHQVAGSRNVYELHGSVERNYCMRCRTFYSREDIERMKGVPRCDCGGFIKPDVVLYEESLNQKIIQKSINALEEADMLIIGGTSLSVYPAAGLIDYFGGDTLVIINKSPTPYDRRADLLIEGSIGEALEFACRDL